MKGTVTLVLAGLLCVFILAPSAVSADGTRRDLSGIFSRLPRGELMEKHPIPAFSRLIEFEKQGVRRVDEAAFDRAENDLIECISHFEQLKNGPWLKNADRLRDRLKLDPAWGSHEFEVVCRPPYLICSEPGGNAGAEFADALYRLGSIFAELVAKPLGLNAPEHDGEGRKVYVFSDSASFAAYQKVLRQPMPPGVTGLYRPSDQWVIAVDVLADEGARGRVLHNAVHQLVHTWTKAMVERTTGKETVWTDQRLHSRSLWFQEGLAEMFSSTRESPDGSLTFMVPLKLRLKEWRATRRAGRSEWRLPELLSFSGTRDLRLAVHKKSPTAAAHLASLFYAQAWSFCWFLWNADGGKHREKFLAYAKRELHGESGQKVFAKVWSGDEAPADWTALEKEWLAHAERQMDALD